MRVLKDDLKIKDRQGGISALNPLGINMAASRGNMGNTQLGKTVAVEGIKPPIILTGHEKSMIAALKQGSVEGDITVVGKVVKHIAGKELLTYIFFIDEDDVIDVIEIPRYETLDGKMLFEHKPTDIMRELEVGDTLESPVFTTTPSNIDGYNAYGVPIEVIFANINEIGEDAIICSESCMEKFAFWMTKEIVINKKRFEHFKNIYGDENVWKGFPDIGEEVREDGILYDMFFLDKEVSYDTIDNLRGDYIREGSPLENKAVYGKGYVYDIEVITQPDRRPRVTVEKSYDQIDFYRDALIAHKRDLVDTYADICKNEGRGLFDDTLVFSPEVGTLIADAMTYDIKHASAIHNGNKTPLPITKLLFKDELQDTQITIKLRYKIVPGKGYKLSDPYGAKGIVAMVLPDEDMPCECILNPLATSDRTIPGRLSETYLAGTTRAIREECLDMIDKEYSESSVDKAINYLIGYYDIVSPKLAEGLRSYNHKDRLDFMLNLEKNELHIHKRFQDDNFIELFETMEASVYCKRDIKGGVKIPNVPFIDLTGKTTRSVLYTTLLNNLPSAAMATDKPRINALGLSPSTSKEVKNKYPYNMQATKILSEPETKIITSYCSPYLIAELRDRMSSTERQLDQCIAILKAEDPANIDVLLDRKRFPFINGIGTEIMNAINITGGIELTHTDLINKG